MRLVPTYLEESRAADDVSADDVFAQLTVPSAANWPGEVDMILSAMEVASTDRSDRRDGERSTHRTFGQLRLFAHDPLSPATALYIRDISPAGMGFITRERLPLGYGGVISYEQADGTKVTAACTIFRCRPSINGWYEGALHFSN